MSYVEIEKTEMVRQNMETRDRWWMSHPRPKCWVSEGCVSCDAPCAEKMYWKSLKEVK